jgi:hypothetical protein
MLQVAGNCNTLITAQCAHKLDRCFSGIGNRLKKVDNFAVFSG